MSRGGPTSEKDQVRGQRWPGRPHTGGDPKIGRGGETELRPRDLGGRFDEVAEDPAEEAGVPGDTASLVSARRRLRGKIPTYDFYRGDEVPGDPKNDDELEAHRSRVKELMKPKWITTCTPRVNGEILCILAKPKTKSRPKKVRRNHCNVFECPVPGCGYVYKGFQWAGRKNNHIKGFHPEKRSTGLGAKSLVAEYRVEESNLPDGGSRGGSAPSARWGWPNRRDSKGGGGVGQGFACSMLVCQKAPLEACPPEEEVDRLQSRQSERRHMGHEGNVAGEGGGDGVQ